MPPPMIHASGTSPQISRPSSAPQINAVYLKGPTTEASPRRKASMMRKWAPPLRMLNMGTGRLTSPSAARYRQKDTPSPLFWTTAPALATAMETARTALTPKLLLSGVPSSSISCRSMPAWSVGDRPTSDGPRMWSTLVTALRTPLPR